MFLLSMFVYETKKVSIQEKVWCQIPLNLPFSENWLFSLIFSPFGGEKISEKLSGLSVKGGGGTPHFR